MLLYIFTNMYVYIYIYIFIHVYVYIYRERERDRDREREICGQRVVIGRAKSSTEVIYR